MAILSTIGAIGDVHAEDARLDRVLAFFRERGLDRILCVGDIVDGAGDADRCCALLEAAGVEAVRGNHDRWLLAGTFRRTGAEGSGLGSGIPSDTASGNTVDITVDVTDATRAFLASLPASRAYDTAAGRLLLCHGLGDNDMNRLTPDDYGYALECNDDLQELLATRSYRFVVNGHSHRRMVKDFGGVTIINVGTLRGDHDPCVAIVDFAARAVEFFDLDNRAITPAARHPL